MSSHSVNHDEVQHCHDCGAAVTYNYCAVCGQETRLHVPSAGEFLHEFVGHYVALEGKLWRTLWNLLLRPGFLSAEYIAGRRARYVQPLRVYLTFSILFFALFKYGGFEVANFDVPPEAGVAAKSAQPQKETTEARFDLSPRLEAKINTFLKKPSAEQSKVMANAFFSYGPYAVFCLMPIFALYLKLLYLGSGRRYGEHLLFALHANAFAYVMLGLAMVAPWDFLRFVLVAWMIAYLPLAMQRVYGGPRVLTALRWVVLALLHVASVAGAIMAAFGLAIVA